MLSITHDSVAVHQHLESDLTNPHAVELRWAPATETQRPVEGFFHLHLDCNNPKSFPYSMSVVIQFRDKRSSGPTEWKQSTMQLTNLMW